MEFSPWLILFSGLVQASVILADTNAQDTAGLMGVAASWTSKPSSWVGNDACNPKWTGIICTLNRVTSIKLSSYGLSGSLSEDIEYLSELQYLDLSYNKYLSGSLPSSIGSLSNLQSLTLTGCSFTGKIPTEIGQLSNLVLLYLNSNLFTGSIPPSVGGLSKLYLFDLADNRLTGGLPVYDGINLGLDNLTSTRHFNLGVNQLSGTIPSQIFNSKMNLTHLLIDNNNFSGSIPPTLGLLNRLQVLRFDNNYQLSGPVPMNINNLTRLSELHLENNQLTGPLPDLTGMNSLAFVDMSNNSFNASDAPSWLTALSFLTSLYLENLHLGGQLPRALFSLPAIQTLRLRGNRFNGTLNIGSDFSTQLQNIDLQDNQIAAISVGGSQYNKKLILSGNPICKQGSKELYCKTTAQSNLSYTTANNCAGLPPTCLPSQLLSPSCTCAVPYKGTLFFRAPSFSDLTNTSYYTNLEQTMEAKFLVYKIPVDSISIDSIFVNANNNLQMNLAVFPSNKILFGEEDISDIGFILSNQTYKPPPTFGPYYFIGTQYPIPVVPLVPSEPKESKSKNNKLPLIVGVAAGGAILVAVLLVLIVVIARRKRKTNKTEERSQPLASLDMESSSTSVPQMRGTRNFTFAELKKITGNFLEANNIGKGGFGKVYRGTLSTGQLVAVKRSQEGSQQGNLEFRTEIELLSRVHHKNVVSLVGFCLDQGEQMLVYEYIPNGTVKESLTGNSGLLLDWKRRLRVMLGAAKGIAYLHEHADPPIVHRDIKSSNILLDERLTAKVADFGLSKLLGEDGRGHVTTQVKGTMGYLDPEYYMTEQLTKKSDVYSFGVLLLEMITAKTPLERGRYIVREVRTALDRSTNLYGLHELLDPVLAASPSSLGGLEQYVDLALRCVEEAGAKRPTMGEAVGELEQIAKNEGDTTDLAPHSMC